jgi:hypothetical protein
MPFVFEKLLQKHTINKSSVARVPLNQYRIGLNSVKILELVSSAQVDW